MLYTYQLEESEMLNYAYNCINTDYIEINICINEVLDELFKE